MKSFHCTHCQNLVFFENDHCLSCAHALAYLPDQGLMAALEQGQDQLWRVAGVTESYSYRLCDNYAKSICNWAVPAADANVFCQSCRLTNVIPDQTQAENRDAWHRLEIAKRRLIYSLLEMGLSVNKKTAQTGQGLQFEFLKDSAQSNGDRNRVLTGHDNGLITINIAEADDVLREQQRKQQNEPYRTVLGHFRHEIGHYYWDRLILDSSRLDSFRALFGDERVSYEESMKRHYGSGPPVGWEQNFISAYATMHPWEDWAETWAHFMHMSDSLESAGAAGLSLSPRRPDEPALPTVRTAVANDFDQMIKSWLPLAYVLNNLSRGLGLADSYPFVLSVKVIEKLRFIFDTVAAARLVGSSERPILTQQEPTHSQSAHESSKAA